MIAREVKYLKTLETLKSEILGGKYSRRRIFPSVTAVTRRFGISRLTAVKVFDKLKELGLVHAQPGSGTFVSRNALARTIGLVMPGVAYSEYYQPIISTIVRLASDEGYAVQLTGVYSQDYATRVRQARDLAADLIKRQVSGVIYQPLEYLTGTEDVNDCLLSAFGRAGLPMVLLDSDVVASPDHSGCDVVSINNFTAGEQLAAHLFERGARHIHFLRRSNWTPDVKNRAHGVACAVSLRGCKWSEDDCVLVADPDDVKAVRRHLRTHPETDAFVCENDTAAVTLCRTLAKLHLKVPDDVMLAGFDDIRIASFMSPPLTTIRQPCEAIAEAAFYRLLQRIRNPMLPPQDIYLPATLVVRESTAGRILLQNPKSKKGNPK